MHKSLHKKGFSFKPTTEYIKETMDIPAFSKLNWLQEANMFIKKAMPKKNKRIWEMFRRGEI